MESLLVVVIPWLAIQYVADVLREFPANPKPFADAAPLDPKIGMFKPYLNWVREANTVNVADAVLMTVYV